MEAGWRPDGGRMEAGWRPHGLQRACARPRCCSSPSRHLACSRVPSAAKRPDGWRAGAVAAEGARAAGAGAPERDAPVARPDAQQTREIRQASRQVKLREGAVAGRTNPTPPHPIPWAVPASLLRGAGRLPSESMDQVRGGGGGGREEGLGAGAGGDEGGEGQGVKPPQQPRLPRQRARHLPRHGPDASRGWRNRVTG